MGSTINTEPTVFVIEPDPVVRDTVRSVASGLELRCDAFANGQDFLGAFDSQRPGCLVLELRIPGINGLLIQEKLVRASAGLPLIFLAKSPSVSLAVHVMRAGAVHFLEKPLHEHDLWTAIQEAVQIDRERRQARSQRDEIEARLGLLTETEIAVLQSMATCQNKQAIAAELDKSVRTVDHHRTHLMRKLKINSTAKLLCFALTAEQHGLLRRAHVPAAGRGENGYSGYADGFAAVSGTHNRRKPETGMWQGAFQ